MPSTKCHCVYLKIIFMQRNNTYMKWITRRKYNTNTAEEKEREKELRETNTYFECCDANMNHVKSTKKTQMISLKICSNFSCALIYTFFHTCVDEHKEAPAQTNRGGKCFISFVSYLWLCAKWHRLNTLSFAQFVFYSACLIQFFLKQTNFLQYVNLSYIRWRM